MNAPRQQDRSHVALSHRNAQDRSIALVLAGLVLLLPPVGAAALLDETVLGLPLPLVYVFSVWALLIAGGALISRKLQGDGEARETAPTASPQSD